MKWLIGLVAVLGAGLTLAGCALTAKDIPYPTLEAKYGGPASRYMDLPGELRVHYRDQGKADGPAVVLVHGFAASAAMSIADSERLKPNSSPGCPVGVPAAGAPTKISSFPSPS